MKSIVLICFIFMTILYTIKNTKGKWNRFSNQIHECKFHKIDASGIIEYGCYGNTRHYLNLNTCIGYKSEKYDLKGKNFSKKCQFCKIKNLNMSCTCFKNNKESKLVKISLFKIIWRYIGKFKITCIRDA